MTKKSIIFGRHPVMDALQTGATIEKLLLQQGTYGDFEREVRQLAKTRNIPVQVVPKERLAKVVRGNHQGIVGFLSLIHFYKLEDVLPTIYEQSETPLILLVDGVTDVRNFGAIARSAAALGVHAIVTPRKGSAQINAEAIKASSGALMNIPVCRENSLTKAIDYLQLSGIQTFVSSLQAKDKIFDLDLTQPIAMVIGSEGDGVSAAILKKVTQHFIIPQKSTTDSFNVSVATGIILYEVVRQRLSVEF